jgi:uncharacterized RDD family membrane protein YckC
LRFYAWLIDSLIRGTVMIFMLWGLTYFDRAGTGVFLILAFLIEWFYPVYFEIFNQGKTPGKSMFGLFVAQENASPVTPVSSLIRNLLRFVDFMPFCYGFGLLCVLSNSRFQRIGDIVAGTVVLHEDVIKQSKQEINVEPITPPVPLLLNEQQALISFYQRRPMLSEERAEELAKISGPLVSDRTSAADYLSGMGSWIMGKR